MEYNGKSKGFTWRDQFECQFYCVHYFNSVTLQVSSAAKLGSQCLPHGVVVRVPRINTGEHTFWHMTGAQLLKKHQGWDSIRILFSHQLSHEDLTRSMCFVHGPFPEELRSHLPVYFLSLNQFCSLFGFFGFLFFVFHSHNDKTQSWKFGDH